MATMRMRMKPPVHPDDFTKLEIIGPTGPAATGAARALGVTCAARWASPNRRAHLRPEMALRIGKALGVSTDARTRLQDSGGANQA